MGYRTNEIGYPQDILTSRATIKRGNFALIPPEGLVKNVIPGFENCEMSILGSPKLGASFVDYVGTVLPGGKNEIGFGGNGVETFIYVLEGQLTVSIDEEVFEHVTGGYVYCPPTQVLKFINQTDNNTKIFLYKRKYEAAQGCAPYIVSNNINKLESEDYEGMTNVQLTDLLPKDMNFDMNFHILSFEPGGSHGYIETHYQEHGAIILTGKGVYNLDNNWIPVKKDDYMFMGAYSLQACYATGQDEPLSYLYSKDCNRDVEL